MGRIIADGEGSTLRLLVDRALNELRLVRVGISVVVAKDDMNGQSRSFGLDR